MKNVVLLGSTGSLGTSTLRVAEDLPDRIRLVGLAAGTRTNDLLAQARRHRPEIVCMAGASDAKDLASGLDGAARVVCGPEGLLELATLP